MVPGDNDDDDGDDDSDDKDDDGGQMTRWVVRFGESGKTVQLVVNGSISYCTTRLPSSSSHPHDGGDDDDNDNDDDLLLDNAQQIYVMTGREF